MQIVADGATCPHSSGQDTGPVWAERRQRRQADFAVDLGVDKGTVSRWFKGTIDAEISQKVIAYLQLEDDRRRCSAIPTTVWMARLLKGRAKAEKSGCGAVLEGRIPQGHGRVARERKAIPCPSNGVTCSR